MALPPFISVEDFFRSPERAGATISPDGRRIAYLAPWKNRLNVWVSDLDSGDEPRRVTDDTTRSVTTFEWTDDPRWLLYLQDAGGDENWHVFRVDLDNPGAPAVDLTPFPSARAVGLEPSQGRPGTMTLHLNIRALGEFDLYELEVATGALTVLAEGSDGRGWFRGLGDSLFAMSTTADGDLELVGRDAATGAVVPIAVVQGADYPMGVFPARMMPDGTGMWIGSSKGTDRTRLVRLDLATGQETEVDSHPRFDIDLRAQVFPTLPAPLIVHRRTGELLGVRYLGERQVIRALDPSFADILKELEALSDGDLASMSSDESGQRWVVSFTHDRDAGASWFYDHGTGETRLLFRPFPHLDPDAMAPTRSVTITARDGLALPSYLTLPLGIEPTGLPLVLLVHGGPWTRDSWGFDRSVQLMANRGYAVLQVNFRGSTGFGKAHTRSAIGEFAGKMHDDLIDGVDWAVEQGYADPARVAIFGGSYGGYAALVGVTFTPDRFAAAVEYVGISDLANFMRTQPSFVKPGLINNWYRYVGDPADPAQEADMQARSPIGRLDDVRTPLMVVAGANDSRVVLAESDNIVESLRARGVEVEYTVFDDEGHGFVNPENIVTMFATADRFLAQHLRAHP